MRRFVAALGLFALSCEESPSLPGMGLDLQLRVRDAQLQRGPLAEQDGGPSVTQVLTPQIGVRRGEGTVQLGGRLGAGGVSLLIHGVGDDDHWQVAPSGFDFVIADELLFGTELEFSHAIDTDTLEVELQAVDQAGRAGAITTATFELQSDVPPAELLVSLGWDAPVDLDLHVELPSGVIVGAKNINAFEPTPGVQPPPDGTTLGGYHDYDSNQQCTLDLRNRENVVWQVAPPPGRYRVYAELFSACDAAAVNFEAAALQGTEPLARSGGTLYGFDAREHARDGEVPGLLVLEFEVR